MNTLVLLVALGLPASTPWQSTPALETAAAVTAEANESADRLAEQAYALFGDRRSWHRAARLLERSAELRSADDPARAEAYRTAGRVYSHAGRLGPAQRAFEKAAAAAAQTGAVAKAAGSYIDAAHIAARRDDGAGARALIDRSALLATSPHLTSAERTSILRRLPSRALAG
jgi:tetratricopeptide (TPR) repeat protein